LLRALKLPSAPRFDEIISVSAAAALFAARWSRMEANQIVPNMLDLAAIPGGRSGNDEGPAIDIAFVGRLVPRKGARELIDAIAFLDRRRSRPTRVAIVGEGPHRDRLQRRVRALGLDESVTFLGRVDDQVKFAVLSAARIACFPSRYGESFGIVILEALAAGAEAVLAGCNPGYSELLAPEGLVDPEDSPAFAARIWELLDDGNARRALGSRQRAMLPRFDSEVVVEEVLRVYRAALARRPRAVAIDSRRMALDVAA
jgi:phosphatidylinositol alpha-mannosyltransferase